MSRQEEQRQENEDEDADRYVAETKPPIASSKLPFFAVSLVRLREELRDVLRLELLEDRVVRRTAASREAREDLLHLKARVRLPDALLSFLNDFGVKGWLLGLGCVVGVFRSRRRRLRRLIQRMFASNESTAFLSLSANCRKAPLRPSKKRLVIASQMSTLTMASAIATA